MEVICEPKRILSAATVSRRLGISRPTFSKHVRRRLVVPDYEALGCGAFFDPARLPELKASIAANRERNWRHVAAAA
jgi:hypothetical protein